MDRKKFFLGALKFIQINYVEDPSGQVWLRDVAKQNAVFLNLHEPAKRAEVTECPFSHITPHIVDDMPSEEERSRAERALVTLLRSLYHSKLISRESPTAGACCV